MGFLSSRIVLGQLRCVMAAPVEMLDRVLSAVFSVFCGVCGCGYLFCCCRICNL